MVKINPKFCSRLASNHKIKSMTRETKKDGLERGLRICQRKKTGDIRLSTISVGNEGSVDTNWDPHKGKLYGCKDSEKYVGDIHVHPLGVPRYFSAGDIAYIHREKLKYACIVSNDKFSDIKCVKLPLKGWKKYFDVYQKNMVGEGEYGVIPQNKFNKVLQMEKMLTSDACIRRVNQRRLGKEKRRY